jgi:predicted component of type VI protein secretion system
MEVVPQQLDVLDMELKLKVETGKHAGEEIRIVVRQFLIGRDDDCHLRGTSEMISRRHCMLIVRDSYAGLRDLDSRNGTLVNGEVVKNREVELRSGDKLCIGPLHFSVTLNAGLTGKKFPAVHGVREAAARSIQGAASTADDIAGWLMESEAKPSKPIAGDTQQMRLSETEAIDLKATGSSAHDSRGPGSTTVSLPAQRTPAETQTEDADENPSKAKQNVVSGPKKLPTKQASTGPHSAAANTRQAAADMIEKMRKRK